MVQLFNPDSPPTPRKRRQGTPFERAATLIERFEFVPTKGGARVWFDLYQVMRAYAEHYRNIGMECFAEKVEVLAARARGAAQRHQFHGPPLPPTLHHPREVLW